MQFGIDEIVGRLTSSAESLYMKTLLHAYTSYVLPDPLTGRTGTEEALSCLYSGSCQPWTPIDAFTSEILGRIAGLSPKREYYPQHLKRQQKVTWDKNLTFIMQHDDFAHAVYVIIEKSQQLAVFAPASAVPDVPPQSHLTTRALSRRSIYERIFSQFSRETPSDIVYPSRDRADANKATSNVLSIVKTIRSWPDTLNTANFASFLESGKVLGGIESSRVFDKFTIHERIAVNLHEQWGAIANLCLGSGRDESFPLMFLFGLMAFNEKADMKILRSLFAFSLFDELKDLRRPSYSEYHKFKYNEAIPFNVVHSTIREHQIPYVQNYNLDVEEDQRRSIIHQTSCTKDTERLAEHLANQWPNASPSRGNFQSTHLRVTEAIDEVNREWSIYYANLKLSKYITEVQSILQSYYEGLSVGGNLCRLPSTNTIQMNIGDYQLPSLGSCLLKFENATMPTSPEHESPFLQTQYQPCSLNPGDTNNREITVLETICENVSKSEDFIHRKYTDDLSQSLSAFKQIKSALNEEKVELISFSSEMLKAAINASALKLQSYIETFKMALRMIPNGSMHWLYLANLCPAATRVTLLEFLRSISETTLGDKAHKYLISFGIATTEMQRYHRILNALENSQELVLRSELENEGHFNWAPANYPDWLLFEIDSDILIREEQVDVARAIISPESKSNSVLQLNMGKGK